MDEHTPGPWSTIGKWVYDVENPSPIAQCLRPYGEGAANANARLIAAAPEMLEALELVVQAHEWWSGGFSPELMDPVRAAIAKAKGAE